MIMQIVRCESAVAQGLRSDTFQATKTTESASMRSLTPTPFGLLVVDLSPLFITSLAPKCPEISDLKFSTKRNKVTNVTFSNLLYYSIRI